MIQYLPYLLLPFFLTGCIAANSTRNSNKSWNDLFDGKEWEAINKRDESDKNVIKARSGTDKIRSMQSNDFADIEVGSAADGKPTLSLKENKTADKTDER